MQSITISGLALGVLKNTKSIGNWTCPPLCFMAFLVCSLKATANGDFWLTTDVGAQPKMNIKFLEGSYSSSSSALSMLRNFLGTRARQQSNIAMMKFDGFSDKVRRYLSKGNIKAFLGLGESSFTTIRDLSSMRPCPV